MRIYLIWADRGDYSDHTEYAVSWTKNKTKAEAEAARLNEGSGVLRRRTVDGDNYTKEWESACASLGDPQWSPSDETKYCVLELEELP